MSLSNMMPEKPRKARGDREKAAKFNRAAAGSEESEDESEYSCSESDESEEDMPIRRRAARNVTYNMKEYDDMMKSAIDDGKVKYSAEEMQGYVAAGTTEAQAYAAQMEAKATRVVKPKEYEDDDTEEEEEDEDEAGDDAYPA